MGEKEIVVLTKLGCGNCEALKKFLQTKRMAPESHRFNMIVKDDDLAIYNKYIRQALADVGEITTLPVVLYKEKVYAVGFSPSEVVSLVENIKIKEG